MDKILERLQKIQRESKATVWVGKDIVEGDNMALDITVFDRNRQNPVSFYFYPFYSEEENEETFKELEDYLNDCEA